MKALIKFKFFVDELSKDNSRLYKLSVLEKYKDDEDIKYYLNFIYNPYIVTGISDKKLNKKIDITEYNLFDEKLKDRMLWIDYPEDSEIFEYVKNHNTGTDGNIWTVQHFREIHIKPELHDLFNKIITKNLPLGIDVKTINKVIPKLIPTFNVQLANKYFEHPESVEGKEFALTTKIDGMRCIMIKKDNTVTFWSRQGQSIEGLVDLEKEALESFPDDCCLDGELVAISDNPDTYKQTMKLARTKDIEKHGLRMLVFDYMSATDFENQLCTNDYNTRRHLLENIFNENSYNHTYFNLLPLLYKGKDITKINEFLEDQTSKGEEGIMINICSALYDFKRTSNLLKVKKMQTFDLQVIGFEEGTNSNKGTLGALLVRYKEGNIVKVGSGFEKELRDDIWNNQKDWLGRIVEIQYFEETENANGGKSLRFPVYKDYRTDKTEADF